MGLLLPSNIIGALLPRGHLSPCACGTKMAGTFTMADMCILHKMKP